MSETSSTFCFCLNANAALPPDHIQLSGLLILCSIGSNNLFFGLFAFLAGGRREGSLNHGKTFL